MPRLLVSITAHGYGHLAQVGAVLNRLVIELPDLELLLHTDLPDGILRRRLRVDYRRVGLGIPADPGGMAMHSALQVDVARSYAGYARFFEHIDAHRRDWRELLRAARPDLLLSNIGWLPLAVAQSQGVANVALCSLNWADIFAAYCGRMPQADDWLGQMRAAYRGADCFIQPEPSMPMADLPNRAAVGPLAVLGQRRDAELRQRLGVADGARLVLVNLGGIPSHIDYSRWPRPAGVHWLVSHHQSLPDGPFSDAEALLNDWTFPDLLASVDLLVGKPGYNLFAEAGCLGLPVIYVERGDWPEEPYLVEWLTRRVPLAGLPGDALTDGPPADLLEALLQQGRADGCAPGGIEQATGLLAERLKVAV